MKNKKQNLLIAIELLVAIMILIGAFRIELTSIKVMKTAVGLSILNDNAKLYNEQLVKTDEMTEAYEANQRIRNEQFYNSEDTLVRVYSNAHVFIKVILVIIAVALIVVTPVAVFLQICVYYAYKCKFIRKRAKTQKKSNLF